MTEPLEVISEANHLRLVRRGTWEYVQRTSASGVVSIVAVTKSRKIILVEQFRPPFGTNVIELPAGLAGDLEHAPDEDLSEAARRELLEETGYAAGSLQPVSSGPTSAGLSDESVTMFLATELTKVNEGGGVDGEEIQVHEVHLDDVDQWLQERMSLGQTISARVYGGLYFAQRAQ